MEWQRSLGSIFGTKIVSSWLSFLLYASCWYLVKLKHCCVFIFMDVRTTSILN
jgi:hypothetical protein